MPLSQLNSRLYSDTGGGAEIGGDFAGNDPIRLLAPDEQNTNRTFTIRAGFDDNNDQQLSVQESDFTIKAILVPVPTLRVTSLGDSSSATNPSVTTLWIAKRGVDVPIQLESLGPTVGRSHILWDVLGGSPFTTTSAHNFGGVEDPTVRLTSVSSGTYDVKIGFDDDGNGSLGVTEIDRMMTIYVVTANITEVTYDSTDHSQFYFIAKDDGSGNYTGPQWLDSNVDGIAENQFPAAFRRGSRIFLDTHFKLVLPAGVSAGGNLRIKGVNADGYNFEVGWDDPSIPMHDIWYDASTGTLVFKDDSAKAFPDWIDHFDTFDINWKISFDGATTWVPVGTTKNQVYTLLDAPTTTAYHTLLYLSSQAAKGETVEQNAFGKIWHEFEDRQVYKAQLPGAAGAPTQLTYWAGGAATATNTSQLFSSDNGQCGAWAEFLIDCAKVQGISGIQKIEVTSIYSSDVGADRRGALLVKDWTFAAVGTAPVAVGYFTHRSGEYAPAVAPGAPAQGNPDPPPGFLNHFIVQYSGRYYDPSYGTGGWSGFASQAAWEDASLDGYAATKLYIDPITGLPMTGIFAKTNALGSGSVETVFTPR